MKALSIRQPWAWLILNAGKDIENRDWPTPFRGRFLIHAGKGMTREEYENGAETYWAIAHKLMPHFRTLERGGIVGTAVLTACVRKSPSPWFFGDYGFELRDAAPVPFRPYKGMLGFFEVPDDDANRVADRCDANG